MDVFKKRNKKIDTHHIHKYNKHKQDSVVVAGSPARTICTIEEFIAKNQVAMKQNVVFGEEYTHRGNVTQKRKDEMIEKLSKSFGYID